MLRAWLGPWIREGWGNGVSGGGYRPPPWPTLGCFPVFSAGIYSQALSLPSCIPAVVSWVAFQHVSTVPILSPLSVLTLSAPHTVHGSLLPQHEAHVLAQHLRPPSPLPRSSPYLAPCSPCSALNDHSLFLLERGVWGPGSCEAICPVCATLGAGVCQA